MYMLSVQTKALIIRVQTYVTFLQLCHPNNRNTIYDDDVTSLFISELWKLWLNHVIHSSGKGCSVKLPWNYIYVRALEWTNVCHCFINCLHHTELPVT